MSRPLIANPKRASEASAYHRKVFARYGHACVFCGHQATDAAHVIGRAHLGPLRYADERLSRPSCRSCHERVDRNEIQWPLAILRDAIKVHNKIARVKIEVPA